MQARLTTVSADASPRTSSAADRISSDRPERHPEHGGASAAGSASMASSLRSRDHSLSRIAAALVGAPAAAVVACAALGAVVPGAAADMLFTEVAAYPVAVVASCFALVADSGRRAWIACVLVAAGGLAVLQAARFVG